MPRATFFVTTIAILSGYAGSPVWALDEVAKGKAIAERWCSSCHLVSRDQTSTAGDAPAFATIASRSASEIDALAGFLADPHPPMPDLSLTRAEIRDLLAYIASLRR